PVLTVRYEFARVMVRPAKVMLLPKRKAAVVLPEVTPNMPMPPRMPIVPAGVLIRAHGEASCRRGTPDARGRRCWWSRPHWLAHRCRCARRGGKISKTPPITIERAKEVRRPNLRLAVSDILSFGCSPGHRLVHVRNLQQCVGGFAVV